MPMFKTADGLSLHYQDEGTGAGSPFLCLPGLTRSGADFDHFAAALDRSSCDRRLIRLDSRGRGQSDHDPDFNNYNVGVEAADVIALLNHLEIEQVIVIGSSRGGLLAMVIAATNPQRLAGVVLNDVGPVVEAAGIEKIMGYLGVPPEAKTLEEAATNLKNGYRAQFRGVGDDFWRDWAERSYRVTPEGLALTYDPRLRDATIAQAKQMTESDSDGANLWKLFDALAPIPTLVLRGENSDLLSAETVAAMQARKSDLRTMVIGDRGHIPRLDEPAALWAISDFAKSLR